ncbi:hypothetical protein LY78DRAFT_119271 [Colletotrichum sublineola]|nr:hypothetical protein LY78DRAFT_119271 [Colletotrichum sublineola]
MDRRQTWFKTQGSMHMPTINNHDPVVYTEHSSASPPRPDQTSLSVWCTVWNCSRGPSLASYCRRSEPAEKHQTHLEVFTLAGSFVAAVAACLLACLCLSNSLHFFPILLLPLPRPSVRLPLASTFRLRLVRLVSPPLPPAAVRSTCSLQLLLVLATSRSHTYLRSSPSLALLPSLLHPTLFFNIPSSISIFLHDGAFFSRVPPP